MGAIKIEGCPFRKLVLVDKTGLPQCPTIGVVCFETSSTVNLTEEGRGNRRVYKCEKVAVCNEKASQA